MKNDAMILPENLITPEQWAEFCEWAEDGGYDQSYFNRWDSKSYALQKQFLEEQREYYELNDCNLE